MEENRAIGKRFLDALILFIIPLTLFYFQLLLLAMLDLRTFIPVAELALSTPDRLIIKTNLTYAVRTEKF